MLRLLHLLISILFHPIKVLQPACSVLVEPPRTLKPSSCRLIYEYARLDCKNIESGGDSNSVERISQFKNQHLTFQSGVLRLFASYSSFLLLCDRIGYRAGCMLRRMFVLHGPCLSSFNYRLIHACAEIG